MQNPQGSGWQLGLPNAAMRIITDAIMPYEPLPCRPPITWAARMAPGGGLRAMYLGLQCAEAQGVLEQIAIRLYLLFEALIE